MSESRKLNPESILVEKDHNLVGKRFPLEDASYQITRVEGDKIFAVLLGNANEPIPNAQEEEFDARLLAERLAGSVRDNSSDEKETSDNNQAEDTERWLGFDKTDYNKPVENVNPREELGRRQHLHVISGDRHIVLKNTKKGGLQIMEEGLGSSWQKVATQDADALNTGETITFTTTSGNTISVTPDKMFVNGKAELNSEKSKKQVEVKDSQDLKDTSNVIGKRFKKGDRVYQIKSKGEMTGKYWVAEVRNVGKKNERLAPKQELISLPEGVEWLEKDSGVSVSSDHNEFGEIIRDNVDERVAKPMEKWELYAALGNMIAGDRVVFEDGRILTAQTETMMDGGEEISQGTLVFVDEDGNQHLQKEVHEAITRGKVVRIESGSADNKPNQETKSLNTQESAQPVEVEYPRMKDTELNEALANLEVGHVVVYADGKVLTVEKIDQISEIDQASGDEVSVDLITFVDNAGNVVEKDSAQLLREALDEEIIYIGKKLEAEGATPEDGLVDVPYNLETLGDDLEQSDDHEGRETDPELSRLIESTKEKIEEVQGLYDLASRLAGEGDNYFTTTEGMQALTKLGIGFGNGKSIDNIREDLDVELHNLKQKLVDLKNNLSFLEKQARGEKTEPILQTDEKDPYLPEGEITSAYVDDLLRRYQEDPKNRNIHRYIESLGIPVQGRSNDEIEKELSDLSDYLRAVEDDEEAASSAVDSSDLPEGKKGFLHRLKDKLKGKEGEDKKGRWKKILGLVAAFGVGVAGGYGAGELWGQAGMIGAGVTGVTVGGGAAASRRLSDWSRGAALMIQGKHDNIGEASLWRRMLYPIFDKPSNWLFKLSESSIKKYIVALGGGLVGGALLHWGTDYVRGHGGGSEVDKGGPTGSSKQEVTPKAKPNQEKPETNSGNTTIPKRQMGGEPNRGGLHNKSGITDGGGSPAGGAEVVTGKPINTTTIEPHLWGKIYETWQGAPDTGKDLTQMLNESLGYHIDWNTLHRGAQFAQISPEQVPDLLAGKIQLPDNVKGVVFTPDAYKNMHSLVDQFRDGLPSDAPEVAKTAWQTIRSGFFEGQGGVNGTKLANELGPEKTKAALEWFAQQLAK